MFKVLGHTKSGKPIHVAFQGHRNFDGWTAVDHWDASEAHEAARLSDIKTNIAMHENSAALHNEEARRIVEAVERLGLARPEKTRGTRRQHATRKSPVQLDREIAEALAGSRGRARYYIAHPDEVAEVTIVFRGLGDYNVKRRYKKPARVRNVSDGDEFFVEESEIFRDPVAAGVRSAELSRHHHATRKGSEPIYTLSAEQIAALRTFAQDNGRNWKSDLNHAWSTGDWSHDYADNAGLLQQIRNTFGPSWLVKFSFNNIKTHGVKR